MSMFLTVEGILLETLLQLCVNVVDDGKHFESEPITSLAGSMVESRRFCLL